MAGVLPPEVKKYDYIDALRGLAVLGTLMVHCSIYEHGLNDYGDLFKRVTFTGAMGVQLFFVMSAFTLFMSYDLKSGREKHTVTNFFVRRFFRIAPLFYVAVAGYLLLHGLGPRYWLGDQPAVTWANILATVTFTNSVNPYWINSIVEGGWSIAIEMVFYVSIPFLFRWIKSLRTALYWFVASVAVASVVYYFMLRHPQVPEPQIWQSYCYFIFPSQFPVFMLGIVLFFLKKENPVLRDLAHNVAIPLLLLGVLYYSHLVKPHIQDHILFAVVFFWLALALSGKPVKLLVNPLTKFLGKISYSMYLVHFGVLYLMWKLNLLDLIPQQRVNFVLRYGILVLLTAGISYVTHRLIEIPGQNLGKRLIVWLENRK